MLIFYYLKTVQKVLFLGFQQKEIEIWLKEAGFILLSVESFKVNHDLTINLFISQKK